MSFTLHPGFVRAVSREPQMAKFLDDIVDEAAREVAELAPVDEGDLRDSVEGDVTLTRDGHVGEVRVGTSHWHFPEYGTRSQSARPYLRPGVIKVLASRGGRLQER